MLSIFLGGCASYYDYSPNPRILNDNNLNDLNGKYDVRCLDYDSISKQYSLKN